MRWREKTDFNAVLIPIDIAVSVVIAVLAFAQAGYLALRVIRAGSDRLSICETLALSYGLGVGLITWQMLVMSLVRIRFGPWRILAVWVVLWVVYVARRRRRRGGSEVVPVAEPRRARLLTARNAWTALLLLPVVITCIAMVFRATFMPVWVWDAWAIWDLKARTAFYDGGVVRFVSDPYYDISQRAHTLLLPLAGTLLYLVLGAPHDAVQIIPVLFYASTLAVFFTTVRRLGGGVLLAAALTTGLAFFPNLLQWSRHFHTESALVFYALGFVSYLYLYEIERRRWLLAVAALLAGFLTQARPEGWLLIVPASVLMAARALSAPDPEVRRTAVGAAAGFILVCGFTYLPWLILKNFVAGVTGGISQPTPQKLAAGLHTLPDVLLAMLRWTGELSLMGEYTLLFPLALVLVVMYWRRYLSGSGERLVLLTAAISIVPAFVLYLVMWYSPWWLSVSGMGRFLIVFMTMTYFVFTVHTVEGWRSAPPGVEWQVWPKVALALVCALLLISAPSILSKFRTQGVSWDFQSGSDGWRLASEDGTTMVSPVTRLDGDAIRTLRLTARGAPATSSLVTLSWKPVRGDYSRDRIERARVRWTGLTQSIVFRPRWRGMIEELTVHIDREAPAFISSIASEPRWLSMLALAVRAERANLPALVALMLGFFVAASLLSTREGTVRALSAGFAAIVVVFWLAPEVSTPLSEPIAIYEYARPIGVVRDVRDSWRRLGHLSPAARIDALEAEAGQSQFVTLIRETARNCVEDGDVLVLAVRGRPETQPAGYVFQRGRYLLSPRRVIIAYERAELEAPLRKMERSSLIVYGAERPADIDGRVAYMNGSGFTVVCGARVRTK